jgi:RNA polymerase sigma-70 factor (ECF subfamily)
MTGSRVDPPSNPPTPRSDRTPPSGQWQTNRVLPVVYEELKRLARMRMARERDGHSFDATALVHEAFLRLVGDRPGGWASRAEFFTAAAEAMRRILIDHARARAALRRGGDRQRQPLTRAELVDTANPETVLAVNEAFERLEATDPRTADIVRMRFFGGLSEAETAASLDLSVRTVRREWAYAKSWLFDALRAPDG